MRLALDTNLLAYAEGINGIEKRDVVLDLVRKLPQEAAIIPVQVLGELFNVLTRKARRSRAEARDAPLSWRDSFAVIETAPEAMLVAADLATDHHLLSDASCPGLPLRPSNSRSRRLKGNQPAATDASPSSSDR